MKIKNFLKQFEGLNSNTFVQVKAGFDDGFIFSNISFFAYDPYYVNGTDVEFNFCVEDNNYFNKILTIVKITDRLKRMNPDWEIERFTISPEPESDRPCPYFDLWLGSDSKVKVKIIDNSLIEIYLV